MRQKITRPMLSKIANGLVNVVVIGIFWISICFARPIRYSISGRDLFNICFKTHHLYLEESARNSRSQDLKDIEIVENNNIKKKFTDETGGKTPYSESIRVKFNALEKFYFFVRRKLESKQKSRKNY